MALLLRGDLSTCVDKDKGDLHSSAYSCTVVTTVHVAKLSLQAVIKYAQRDTWAESILGILCPRPVLWSQEGGGAVREMSSRLRADKDKRRRKLTL